jgi:Phosphotransferase enzyme family
VASARRKSADRWAEQWTRSEWRAEAERWIHDRLDELGVRVEGEIEQPHVRPWATALLVPTRDGPVWFKACIDALAYEIPLLELLRGYDGVPHVIAGDRARCWMLLADAGSRLHELDAGVEHWERFMAAYAQLQIDTAPLVNALVDAGVPDSRRPRMFADLEALLAHERNLRASPEDFVSREQVLALRAIVPRLREHAAALDALGLPATVQHDDLHQWNVFVHDDGYVFLDWGDSCVSHPLLSLRVPFNHAEPSFRESIRDAYLEPWTALSPRADLLAMCDSALLLAQVTAILKWSRIYSGLAVESRGAYDEVISDRAAELLESASA